MTKTFRSLLGAFLILSLISACSQARRGFGSRGANDELWSPVALCELSGGRQPLGCFEIQLNLSQNLAYIYVGNLGFDPNEFPYRVLARRSGESNFHLLADNINMGIDAEMEVPAKKGHRIEEYEEWRIETGVVFAANGMDVLPMTPGKGMPVAQAVIVWQELTEQEDQYADVWR